MTAIGTPNLGYWINDADNHFNEPLDCFERYIDPGDADLAVRSVVGPDGRPHEIRVARSLGMGLDEKAMEAVRVWRFDPARKDGHPVAVEVSIEVNFRLY